jgi:hypothetical protein
MNPNFAHFQKSITNPVRFALFKLVKLPAAFVAGLRIKKFTTEETIILVKHKWINQNPFHSMYFAVQAMAAEMSTGLFAVAQTYKRQLRVSMLVVNIEGKFIKKATGTILFTCNDGALIDETVEQCLLDGEPRTIQCKSVGRNEQGVVVAEFIVTWSFKAKLK